MGRASLEKEPHEVAAMFDGVAEKYDRTNTVLALGQDRMWRRCTREALDLKSGERVLDLAAGTGVSTQELARSGATAIGADFSVGMLRAGRRARPSVPLVAADALALPFADDSFDAVTISFGLRNIVDPAAALREMARVTRPGGRLVVCEFSHPVLPPFRLVYLGIVLRTLPVVARRVASNPDAYVYLAESIPAWPDQEALAGVIQQAGWAKVAWRNLTGGVVALHRATKP
ncbi:demethylmenaquinone methyltransferase [Virgisporangium aurantiacum]|uniref:demethylmenaquinone methyltransferase n=1 Tax=Virgisporangium aurantiacum TaxID=175570 RepID=UPI0035713DB1